MKYPLGKFTDESQVDPSECDELTEQFLAASNRQTNKKNNMPKIASKKPVKSTPEIEVDSMVTFDNDGDSIVGKVTEIDGKTATVEDDENAYEVPLRDLSLVEEEPEAEEPVKRVKGKLVKSKDEPDPEDEDEDEPKSRKPSKGKGKSLASLLSKAEPAEVGKGGIPEGEWDAIIVDAGLKYSPKGASAFFEYVGTNEDEEEVYGKSSKKMFFLTDENGEPTKSMNYFLTDLATLGHEDLEFEDDDEIVALLKKIAKAQPWVEINVVPRKDDPRYNNIYLNALKEDQDDKPDLDDIPY